MKSRSSSTDHSSMEMADCFTSQRYLLKNKFGDQRINNNLNSVISFLHQQIIDLLVISTDKSFYFPQPHPITVIIIRYKCFFLFIGREPNTWPTNNLLQIMVCSCAMSFNSFWQQILFCSCVNESTLFSFLRSLLRENGRSLCFLKIFLKKQTRWSNDKTITYLGYRKI